MKKFLEEYFVSLKNKIHFINTKEIGKAISLLEKTIKTNNFIFCCGNGGSAAISNHFQVDYLKGVNEMTGKKIRIVSLSSNIETITAIANDKGYENVFVDQFKIYSKKNDILFPCYVQPKLDGFRCMTSNKKAPVMKSRAGLEFKRIPHLIEEAKKFLEVADGLGHGSIYIDGELYTDKIPFEELSGCIRMEDESDPEKEAKLKLIEYHIYDLYCADNPEMDYEDRKKLLDSIFKKKKFSHLKNVETDNCKNKEDVEDFHSSFIEKGYEGCMLRNKLGAYLLRYRSNDLLKYKKFEDGEFEVCGYEEAKGEDVGTIIWECFYVSSDGKKEKFKVRPKGSREFRRELFENAKKSFKKMYLGKLLTVRFQEISKDGCPRFPVGIGIRHDI